MDLSKKINVEKLKQDRYIHSVKLGVNDIDVKDGNAVFRKMTQIIEAIWSKAPNIKIIINEITPRNDDRDEEVIECNKLLSRYCMKYDKVFLAKQGTITY